MTGDETLSNLAAALGIEPDYTDALGVKRHAPDETIAALCGAFGFDVSPNAVDALRHEAHRTLLPPAAVVRKAPGGPVSVDITVEVGRAANPFEWTLTLEDGAVVEGRATPADMMLVRDPSMGGQRVERRRWVLRDTPAHGYHRLHLASRRGGGPDSVADLIVAPTQCYVPPALGRNTRLWGFALQLYGLRSGTNWGIGDFSDLHSFIRTAASLGADIVGLNPLHALFPSRPEACSPYSPSSRLFLNILYLDVTAVPDFRESNEAQRVADADRFRALRGEAVRAPLVAYGDVAALKLPVLEQLYASFRQKHLGGDGSEPSARGDAFRRFQRERGDALVRLGVFEALSERFAGRPDWRDWPEAFRTPDSDAVRRFAEEREDRVEFFQYLQWECDRQLHAASAAAADAEMGIGLYQDIAVGLDRTGAEAWANRHLLADGASIGAPPDDWNLKGQNWGLVPYDPRRLRQARYMPLREMFRALMAPGGALRIDHVMGLRRLFWIPDGRAPSEGAYVRYPFDDLLGIVALESWRQRCMVIGEDLGTVPAGFRERMQRERIYSYRLFYFARGKNGAIAAPEDYPPQSVASVSTHDLATLPGYWTGHDLAVRAALGLFPSAETERDAAETRREDRERIVEALRQYGLLPPGEEPSAGAMPFELVLAVHRYLAQCGSRLMVVQLEDILDIVEQANMPGTTTEHPNWRRKVGPDLDALAGDPRVLTLAAALRALRPGPVGKAHG